jgi:succinate dehydrogenase / fumarate reductase cytochrome b subunit
MAVSIFHRVSGHALALAGLLVFAWWLVAAALGDEAYAVFLGFAGHWFGQLLLVGITWAFFQHLFSGLRHFVMDAGHGYEVATAQRSAALVFILALAATAIVFLLAWFF